jgi:hypothetical protein
LSEKDGGPAFPQSIAEINSGAAVSHDFVDGVGMTLRDYFAGQALTSEWVDSSNSRDVEKLAATCYRIADAMLKERAK